MLGLRKKDFILIVTDTCSIAFNKNLPQPLLYRDDKLMLTNEFMQSIQTKPLSRKCVIVRYDKPNLKCTELSTCDMKEFVATLPDVPLDKRLSTYNVEEYMPLFLFNNSEMVCKLCPFEVKQDVKCSKVLRPVSTEGLSVTEMPCEVDGEDPAEEEVQAKDDMVSAILLELRRATSELKVCEFLEPFNEKGQFVLQRNGRIIPVYLDDALEIQGAGMASLCAIKARDEWRSVSFYNMLKTGAKQFV